MNKLLAMLLGSLCGAHALAAEADCAALRGNVEQAMCASPQLTADGEKVDALFA